MILCELGQAWKGAAAADDSCAGMWLENRHPNPHKLSILYFHLFTCLFCPKSGSLYLRHFEYSFPFAGAHFALGKMTYPLHTEYI